MDGMNNNTSQGTMSCCQCAAGNSNNRTCMHIGACSLCSLHSAHAAYPFNPLLSPTIPIPPFSQSLGVLTSRDPLLAEILEELKKLNRHMQNVADDIEILRMKS